MCRLRVAEAENCNVLFFCFAMLASYVVYKWGLSADALHTWRSGISINALAWDWWGC